jgi:hypothetical protein
MSPTELRSLAATLSYTAGSPEPAAKHALIEAAMQIEALAKERDDALAARDRSCNSEQALRAEIDSAFRKHGLAAGPRALDAVIEERNRLRQELKVALTMQKDLVLDFDGLEYRSAVKMIAQLSAKVLTLKAELDTAKLIDKSICLAQKQLSTIEAALAGTPITGNKAEGYTAMAQKIVDLLGNYHTSRDNETQLRIDKANLVNRIADIRKLLQ